MNSRFKIIMILALIALVSCVSAINVSFADPDTLIHRDVYVYGSAGTLLGVYNTTSSGISVVGDSMFVLKPQYSTPLDDPAGWLEDLFAYGQTYSIPLFFVAVIIGIALGKRW